MDPEVCPLPLKSTVPAPSGVSISLLFSNIHSSYIHYPFHELQGSGRSEGYVLLLGTMAGEYSTPLTSSKSFPKSSYLICRISYDIVESVEVGVFH